jgi:hypothetical protein
MMLEKPMCCRWYEKCAAPICPLDVENLNHRVFYPDDPICKRNAFASMDFIRAQRKIAKRAASPDEYFTLAMLQRHCVIKTGIRGLDPDRPEGPQLERWMEAHPSCKRRTISPDHLRRMREGLDRYRKGQEDVIQAKKRVCIKELVGVDPDSQS